MDIREIDWIRNNVFKLDKHLRSSIFYEYRTISRIPCFLQPIYRIYHQKIKKYPIIIQMEPTRGNDESKEILTLLTRGNKKTKHLRIIHGFASKLSLNEIKTISQSPIITKVYLDQEVRTLLNYAIPTVKSNIVWQQGYTGKGVTIAVLDTGIVNHSDFIQPLNRVIAFKDFSKDDENTRISPYDDNGHGTHCAGCAAGNGSSSGSKYMGAAPEASIVALKVLDRTGGGNASNVIQGLQWCLDNKEEYNIRVVSLSLGYKATQSYNEDPVCAAVGSLWDNGIVVCAAAGNDGPDTKSINSPGIHPSIITVGASNDFETSDISDDTVADFSSRGPTVDGLTKPDLLVPGANITAAAAKGSYLYKTMKENRVDNWYLNLSGTSMATPLCAGIIAQLLEAHPHLKPDEVKQILANSCSKIVTSDANTQGNGIINAVRALTAPGVEIEPDLTS